MPSSAWKKQLNSSHLVISYAVFCLEKKTKAHALCARLCCSVIVVASLIVVLSVFFFFFFFFNDTATTEIYTLSLHDALPICGRLDRTSASTGTRPQSP